MQSKMADYAALKNENHQLKMLKASLEDEARMAKEKLEDLQK